MKRSYFHSRSKCVLSYDHMIGFKRDDLHEYYNSFTSIN